MKNLTKTILAAALISGAGAYGAAEVVVNGGFETGQLAPWTTDKFVAVEWARRSGQYGAGVDKHGSGVWAYLRQDLGTTIYPSEVISAEFWGAGGTAPGGSDYNGRNSRSLDVLLGMKLGENQYYGENWWNEDWHHIVYPLSYVKQPFSYIYLDVDVYDPAATRVLVVADDASLLITMTGLGPTSIGRVKALFK